jgi:hypothetical protein
VRRAAHQLDAQVLLEEADLAAERRLRDVQPLGRPGEVPLLGDRQEVPQPSQAEHAVMLRARGEGAGGHAGAL